MTLLTVISSRYYGGDEENSQSFRRIESTPDPICTQIRYPCALFALKTIHRIVFLTCKPIGVQFSYISHKKSSHGIITVTWFLMVETRRIELLSENLFTRGSPSAVCGQHSLSAKSANKLLPFGSFIIRGRLKALPAHVHHSMTPLSRPWSFG